MPIPDWLAVLFPDLLRAFPLTAWSSHDARWAIAYAVVIAVLGLLWCLRLNRLLILVSSASLVGFVAANAVLAGTGFAWLMLLWLTLVAGVLGNLVLRFALGAAETGTVESLTLSTAIGFGLLSLVTLVLGLLGLLRAEVLIGLLLAITAVWVPSLVHGWQKWLRRGAARFLKIWRGEGPRLGTLVFAAGALCLLGSVVWAVAPSIHYDALNYHLGVTAAYAREHRVFEMPEEFRSYWAHNAEMLYLLALVLCGQPLPTLVHLVFGIVNALLVSALGARTAGWRAGVLSMLLFASMPLVAWEAGVAYVDLIPSAFAVGAFYALVRSRDGNDRWLIVAGILAGLGLGTKISSAIAILPLCVLAALTIVWRTRFSVATLMNLLRIAVPICLLAVPWWFRDWAWTGNPVFPFLNAVFRSPKWPVENTFLNFSMFGVGNGLTDFLRLPWDLTFSGGRFGESTVGALGVVPLLCLPWLYWQTARRGSKARAAILLLASYSLICFVLWFRLVQYLRYMIPVFAPLCVLCALNLMVLVDWLRGSQWRRPLMALGLAAGLLYLFGTRVVFTTWGWQIPERYPTGVALGQETVDSFLSRALPAYDSFQYLNRRVDAPGNVLSVGNEFRMYAAKRMFTLDGMPELSQQIRASSLTRSLADYLVGKGFDFILVNRNFYSTSGQRDQIPVTNEAFLQKFARLEFARNGMYVYRLLPPETSDVSAELANQLANPGFESLDQQGMPSGWFSYGKPVIVRSKAGAHSGEVAVRADRDSGLFQRIVVGKDQLVTLGHWTRADKPGQSARIQINWLDGQLKITAVSIDVVPVSGDWQWHQMSVSAPDGAAFAQVYVSVHESSEVWFDDVQFVLGDAIKVD